MDNARTNLRRLTQERGASLTALSRMIGRNPAYLQQYVSRGSPKRLEERDRRLLAQYFGVAESLLGAPEDFSYALSTPFVDVPRLDAQAAAGAGGEGGDRELGHLGFTSSWLRAQGLDPAHCSAIAVRGDSMAKTLADGDEILVDTRPLPLRSGIYVVRIDGLLLVKRLTPERPGWLISDNDVYPPVQYDPADLAVIGRVVWKGGPV